MFDISRVPHADVYIEFVPSPVFGDEIRVALSNYADENYAEELMKLRELGFSIQSHAPRRYILTRELIELGGVVENIAVAFENKGLKVKRVHLTKECLMALKPFKKLNNGAPQLSMDISNWA